MNIKEKRRAQSRSERTREHVERAMKKARRPAETIFPEADFTSQARRMGFNVIEAPTDFDRAMEDDKAFFAAHPDRAYRLRRTSPGELEVERMVGGVTPPHIGHFPFTLVHKTASGQRQRQTVSLPIGADVDAGEAEARAWWEEGAPPGSELHRIVEVAALHLNPGAGAPEAPTTGCLCIRLPIRPGAYATETEAVEALERFADAGLGRPTVVGPGDAVYGVWRLTKPVPFAKWMDVSRKLESVARSFGLHLDGPVTGAPPFDLDMLVPGTLAEASR